MQINVRGFLARRYFIPAHVGLGVGSSKILFRMRLLDKTTDFEENTILRFPTHSRDLGATPPRK